MITDGSVHRKENDMTGRRTMMVLETKMKFALIGAAALTAAAFATPALAQAVIEDPGYCAQFLPECRLPKPRTGQSVHQWRLLAERQRVRGTSLAPSLSDTPRIMEKEAAKRPLPTAALYGLQNLQRLDNDLSVSERHRVSLPKQAVRATSAFRPIVERTSRHVRKVPLTDVGHPHE